MKIMESTLPCPACGEVPETRESWQRDCAKFAEYISTCKTDGCPIGDAIDSFIFEAREEELASQKWNKWVTDLTHKIRFGPKGVPV